MELSTEVKDLRGDALWGRLSEALLREAAEVWARRKKRLPLEFPQVVAEEKADSRMAATGGRSGAETRRSSEKAVSRVVELEAAACVDD